MNMKTVAFALTFSLLGALCLTGCSSDGGGASTEPPPAVGEGPGGTMPGSVPPGAPMPGAMGQGQPNPMGGGQGKVASVRSSFDLAPDTIKQQWGQSGGQGSGAPTGGSVGGKPSPIRDGVAADAPRRDPFESVVKPIVQIAPAWDLVIPHRTAPMPAPPVIDTKTGIPDIDLPPLPPIPRRIAGVFYNGSITAIIESGSPPDSVITIVQPGAEVESGIPGIPALVVESITMDSIVLRAKDGRTVDVKLSGLSPAVQDALRQQFSGSGTGGSLPGGGGGSQGGGSAPRGGNSGGGADLK